MQRDGLIALMMNLLRDTLAEQGTDGSFQPTESSPLIGAEAVLTSLNLVSFITDVESLLADEHQVEVILVNEQALSRKQSPFRTVETLADYILELSGAPRETGELLER